MAQLDLFQQFQRGKTPDAEILGFLINYVDATLTMIKIPAEHLFSFGGGHYNAKNMVEKMNFLLKSMAGKMAKDIFNVESISQPAQVNQIVAESAEIISDWFIRGFLPPVPLMKMEGDFANYLLYSPNGPQSRDLCLKNRLGILRRGKSTHTDLDEITNQVKLQWSTNTPSGDNRFIELTTGKMPVQVVALIDLIGWMFLGEAKEIGFSQPSSTPTEKVTQILLMMTIRLARIVYFEQEAEIIHNPSKPEILRKIQRLQNVIITWFFSGLLAPLEI